MINTGINTGNYIVIAGDLSVKNVKKMLIGRERDF